MFSLRSLRDSMARTSKALSLVAKDTPGLPALVSTQSDISDILDPRIPYDGDSSSRRLLSGNSEFSLAESRLLRSNSPTSVSVPELQRELSELSRRTARLTGGSFAIKYARFCSALAVFVDMSLSQLLKLSATGRRWNAPHPTGCKASRRTQGNRFTSGPSSLSSSFTLVVNNTSLHVRELKLRISAALQRLKYASRTSAFASSRQLESNAAALAVSLGRRKGAGVYAMFGDRHDGDGAAESDSSSFSTPSASLMANEAGGSYPSDSRRRNADDVDSDGIMNHERTTDALAHSSVNDPALLADQSSSEFTGHSVRRGRTEGRNSLRMKDVRSAHVCMHLVHCSGVLGY
jgi:hypothetical protein